mgnify:FL=1
MRATYPDKSQTAGTTGLTTHKHDGASVQTDFAECRHSQAIVPRQTTGPDGTRNTGGAAGRNTSGPAAALLTNRSGPIPA